MRIWHILESYPPDYGGGAAITTRDVCRWLASHGHEVRVLCTDNSEFDPYTIRTEYDGTIRVDRVNLPYFRRIDPDGWKLGPVRWRAHEKRIAEILDRLIVEWEPHIIDYHTSRPFGEECLVCLKKRRVPIVATLHEGWLICPRLMLLRSPTSEECTGPSPIRCLECMYSHFDGSHGRAALKLPWRLIKLGPLPAYRIWRRSVARRAVDGAIARSQFMERMHQPHINGPVRHLALGIDLNHSPDEYPKRPRTPLRFGFFGGFQQTKGIANVFDAAATLKRDGLDFELHVWGPTPESGLQEVTKRQLEDRVFLRGMYSPDERWSAYSEIDVALMATTVCEPLGRVPLEAAAAGAPTIAPAIGGIVETIRDGIDGLLFRFRDVKDLQRQMRRVIEEPGLIASLIDNLAPVPDIRERGAAVEQFYFETLGIRTAEIAGIAV